MNNIDNSFFYFYSATPQVLAAIITLLGVFVIFKIQSIKGEMIGMGDTFMIAFNSEQELVLSQKRSNSDLVESVKSSVFRRDIFNLGYTLRSIDNEIFSPIIDIYYQMESRLISLIRDTIRWGVFTAILIFVCLSLIPFGPIIISMAWLMRITMAIIILCIGICLRGFVIILRNSLDESK